MRLKINFWDAWNFLGKLRIRRCWNVIKVLSSYHLTRWTGRPIQWGLPFSIAIEPTTACNLRCPECPSGLRAFTRPTGKLQLDFFRQTIDRLQHKLLMLIFYFQGEPFLNPDFLKMVYYANQKGIYTITSTNGHFLDDEQAKKTIKSGLDRLIISIDGTTQEVYEQYRKSGNLDLVLQGARNMVKWKKKLKSRTPHLIFQFLVVRPNEHQIPAVYELAQTIGVDEVRLKTAQIYNYQNGNPLIPTQERYARYQKMEDGTYQVKNKMLNHCWKLWHSCVITWDGKVVPCCFDKDAQHRLGDLKEDYIEHIWQGTAYANFRKKLLLGRQKIDICTNCTEGCKVWEEG